MRAIWCLVCAASLASCWSPRYFAPRENVNGTGPGGEAAAVYSIDREEEENGGGTRGELRLWSQGARARFTDEHEEVVDLHIGFEVENNGSEPFELATGSVAVEELFVDGYLQDPLEPVKVSGSGVAAPGETARVDFVFRPPTTYPSSLDSFAVRFAMRDADGNLVGQVTPFTPAQRRRRAVVGGGAAWGPFWGGYYGWGPVGFWGARGYWGGFRCW